MPSSRRVDLSKIRGAISAQKESIPKPEIQTESEVVDKLVQDFERLSEEVGQYTAFRTEIGTYITTLNTDLGTKRTTRTCIAWLTFVIIVLMLLLTTHMVFNDQSLLHKTTDTYLKVALFTAPLVVTLAMVAILVRGAFTMPTKDDIPGLPEHVKIIVETIKNFRPG